MLKKFCVAALGLAIFALPPVCQAQAGAGSENVQQLKIIDTADGQEVSAETMADKLTGYDVIMFGEFHDQRVLHELEADLLEVLLQKIPAANAHTSGNIEQPDIAVQAKMAAQSGEAEENFGGKTSLVLSMEMFERDVQPQLNSYLAGDISEEAFLAQARPWPNYNTDYRPLVELARLAECDVLAANVPRYFAAQYAKSGNLDGLNKEWMAEKTYTPEGAYKERFFQAMEENSAAGGMALPPSRYQAMYQAQCLKDDTMAESISRYMEAHPSALVYHVQGEFHGSSHLGVAQKLQALQPQVKIAVIAPVKREKAVSDAEFAEEYRQWGEFLLIFTPEE